MQENSTTTETAAVPESASSAPRKDKLELLKELSRGSVGTVHKARSPQANRMVALRQFQVPEWLDDVNALMQRIMKEARAASGLDHPGIAHLYTCGYREFTVFMTAEFVEGQTLRELLSSRSPDLNEVLNIAKQLCAALDYAHDKGVFHHFLNTSNIKVFADGTVKVLDFGLLRDKELLSHTPAKKLENEPYLSPEQVRNKLPDRAANLFSAATIIYELYTQRNPFSGKHLGEVDRAITDTNPHPLQMAHHRVPESISRVVLKALSKNPVERYASGQALIKALEEAAKEQPRANATGSRPAFNGNATGSHPVYNGNATGSHPVYNGNATGSHPVYKDPAPSTGARPVFQNPEPATGARSPFAGSPSSTSSRPPVRDIGNQTIRIAAPKGSPSGAATTRIPGSQTTTRVQVSSTNHWKLVAIVVACLVVVGVLAMMFQRRPVDIPAEATDARPVASAPKRATAPPPFSAPQQVSTPQQQESAPAETSAAVTVQPVETVSRSSRNKRGSAQRAERVKTTAPAGPAQGELGVSSFPPGATVTIEGRSETFQTPQALGPLPVGTYKVTVTKPGYAPEIRSLQVTAGNRTSVDVKLTAVKVWLTVSGSPAGANVLIDGKDTGRVTPVELILDPASHTVTVRKSGYLDTSTEIKMVAGQSTNYAPTLMVAGRTDNIRIVGNGGVGKYFGGNAASNGSARIDIRSEPKGAQVLVNGTPLQKTTPVIIQVDAGSYDITLQKDGYKSMHESAIVGADDTVKIERTLSR